MFFSGLLSSAEAPMLASLSWNVGKGKPLKEYKVERCFRAKKKYKHASKQRLRFTSEVISLAVLWTDSRTYQDNLGEFLPLNKTMDTIKYW